MLQDAVQGLQVPLGSFCRLFDTEIWLRNRRNDPNVEVNFLSHSTKFMEHTRVYVVRDSAAW